MTRNKPRGKSPEYQEDKDAAKTFERGLTRILSVTKEELTRREYDYNQARKDKPKRGPKPTK